MSRIKLGQVGGGEGAFIGAVHRMAARLDDRFELVAGAFSSLPDRSRASARTLNVADDRSYDDYRTMAAREAARADGIQAVSVVTPNHLHYPVAREFLRHGIHVVSDKPLTSTLEDARRLAAVARTAHEEHGTHLAVTYNYSGYPLVRQAREMVAAGEIGDVRLVQVEYVQDWLAEAIETEGQKQAGWRTDPAQAGAGGSIGDIGTHAFHLAGFVSGEQPERLSADLHTFVEGRPLDDNAHIWLRYASGARGTLWCSQIAPGRENGLRLRVYGSRGGLEWHQENPNVLRHAPLGEPPRLLTRGGAGLGTAAGDATRIPAGHPEGYLEGFATLYREVADLIAGGKTPLLPTVEDGLRGVEFVDAAIRSNSDSNAWVSC